MTITVLLRIMPVWILCLSVHSVTRFHILLHLKNITDYKRALEIDPSQDTARKALMVRSEVVAVSLELQM